MRNSLLAHLLLPFVLAPALAATDPGTPGPFTTATQAVQVPLRAGGTRATTIYYPAAGSGVDPAAGLCPPIVFGHGFNRSISRYAGVARHFASRGFIVLLGEHPCGILAGCDHSAVADEMVDVLRYILAKNDDAPSIFYHRVDVLHPGASGHSAGGMQSLVATAREPRIAAAAPFDPVDNNGLGAAALASVGVPVAITYSEPSSCNSNGSAATLYAAAFPQKRGVKLVGANHCDPEQDNDLIGCALTCGSWNAVRHERYMRYVTGWFEYYLHCDSSYRDWVFGTRPQSDLAAGLITYDAQLRPPAPRGVGAAWTGGVEISRQPPSQCGGIDSWSVLRREPPAPSFETVASGLAPATTRVTDRSAAYGRSYEYVARDTFQDFVGAAVSADSNVAPASTPPGPPGETSGTSPLLATRGAGSAIDLTFAPASCASDHASYWGRSAAPLAGLAWTGAACPLGTAGSATIDPGPVAPGALLYFVLAANDGLNEGSYGRSSSGAERPEAAGLPGCDYPQVLGGSCP